MTTLIFSNEQLDSLGITCGVKEMTRDFDFSLGDSTDTGISVALRDVPGDRLRVLCREGKAEFAFDFTRRNHFFRCLGLLLEKLAAGERELCLEETAWFRHNGPMLDMSQGNAVLSVRRLKDLLRRMAVMGLNQCLLYMEDSYTVPEEPYFGYMRSRYSYEELKELDDYADSLGIEMIPAVQSLSHFTDVLKWEVYKPLREDKECLVPEQEETYTFLRHLFTAASKPFRTNRINLCMDEAMHLGLGTYLRRNGLRPRVEIMQRHLSRVLEITKELGLRPMIADDMFFRSLGGHYKTDITIPEDFVKNMPRGFDMLYWDYYSTDPQVYRKLIDLRRQVAEKVVFEGGIWTWVGFAPNWSKTFITTNLALDACKEKGVDDIQATVWGDSGTECDIRMILLGLQLFAEHGFMRGTPSEEHLRRRFAFCTGGDYDSFYDMQNFDRIPGVSDDNLEECNPSKFLLWQDPMCGLFDKNIEGLKLKDHYKRLEERLSGKGQGLYGSMFETYRLLAGVLTLKSELGVDIHKAYAENDRKALLEIRDTLLPELILRVRALRSQHRKCWKENCKSIGWEVFDMRYGSLLIRLESTGDAIGGYLDGTLERIEELEERQLPYDGQEGIPSYTNFYGRLVSASRIAPEDPIKLPKVPLSQRKYHG